MIVHEERNRPIDKVIADNYQHRTRSNRENRTSQQAGKVDHG